MRNSRNHPRAFLRHRPAIAETIAIVILERSAIAVPIASRTGARVRALTNKRLWHLIAGTRGGINRAKIIWFLRERPSNANAIAGHLRLDYKTVRHHLAVLRANDVVMSSGADNGYSTMYSLTPRLQTHFEEFLEIWSRFRGKLDTRGSLHS